MDLHLHEPAQILQGQGNSVFGDRRGREELHADAHRPFSLVSFTVYTLFSSRSVNVYCQLLPSLNATVLPVDWPFAYNVAYTAFGRLLLSP